MQCRLAKTWMNVTEVLEQLKHSAALSVARRGHATHIDQLSLVCAARQRQHGRSAVLADERPDHGLLPPTQSCLRRAISTRTSRPLRSKETSEHPADHEHRIYEPHRTAEAPMPLPRPNVMPTPGSVVMGFDDSITSAQPPSWAPSLVQGRFRAAPEDMLELAAEPLPADPETIFPTTTTPPQTVPRVRHWRDWASRAKSIDDWLRLVHNNLLRRDVPLEEVSFVHISSAQHAMAVLLESLRWREDGADASQQVQECVNMAILDLAAAIEQWPTCNNYADVAGFLWRVQQLCIVKCPEHVKVRSSPPLRSCMTLPMSLGAHAVLRAGHGLPMHAWRAGAQPFGLYTGPVPRSGVSTRTQSRPASAPRALHSRV